MSNPLQLLDFVAGYESRGNYNAYYGNAGNQRINLTGMTLNQVQEFQAGLARRTGSSAAGRYQIMQYTMPDIMRGMGLTGNEMFTPELQDEMGMWLLKRRGLDRYLAGEISPQAFGDNLAQEWAALPRFSEYRRSDGVTVGPGQSHYANDSMGNKALIDRDTTMAAILAVGGRGTMSIPETRTVLPQVTGNLGSPHEGRTVSPWDGTTPRTGYSTIEQNQMAQQAQNRPRPSIWEGVGAAMQEEQMISWLFRSNPSLAPEPGWQITPEASKAAREGIPPIYWGAFDNVGSEAQLAHARSNILRTMENDRVLDELGGLGIGLRLFSAVTDPIQIGLGIGAIALTGGTGGAAAVSARAGRFGHTALNAGIGGATNAAVDGFVLGQRPGSEASDLMTSVALGMVLGGAYGALAYNPAYRDNYLAVERLGREMARGEVPLASPGSSVGAAQSSQYETRLAQTSDILRDGDDAAPRSFMSWARFDLAGRGKASDNTATRMLFNHLVEDGARNINGATPIAASEVATFLNHGALNRWYNDYQPAFRDFYDRNRANYASKDEARFDFGKQVTEAVRNRNGFEDYDPAVKRGASSFQTVMEEWRQHGVNPGKMDGRTLAGLPGIEDTPANRNFAPRINDQGAWQHHLHTYGNSNMTGLISQAFRSAAPDMEAEVADRLAGAYVTTMQRLSAGNHVSHHRALSGDDMEGLRNILRDETDLSEADLDSMLSLFNRSDDGSAFSHGKRRAFLDESFTMKLPRADGTGADVVRVSDLWVNDADQLMLLYSRQMAGRVAMARVQIRNPNWREGDEVPEYFVNGIRSDAEWAKVMDLVGDVGTAQRSTQLGNDKRRLQFVYDTITGRPTWDESSDLNTYLRILRDYQFLRVGNMMGAAQIPELMTNVAQVGVKSMMANIPGFRAMVRDARTGRLRSEHAAEIEAATTIGTEWQRGWAMRRYDEFENPLTGQHRNSAVNKADRLLQKGGRLTTAISGLSAVNTFLERWAAGAMFDNFYRHAFNPKVMTQRRLQFLGLNDDMVARVGAQMRTHAKGNNSGHLQQLNLREWDDLEALNAVEMAIFRWTRSTVQNNDIGQLNMLFSSPVGRTITQFRSFVLAAWTKQFLQGLNYASGGGTRELLEVFTNFAGTAFAASMVYVARSAIQAAGRSDADAYLEDRLSIENIAAAGLQNSSWFSLLAPAGDALMYSTGQDPVFGFRNSGVADSAVWGNPTFDFITGMQHAARGVAGMAAEGEANQTDLRRLKQMAPFQNALGIMQLFDLGISHAPERPPRRD